jgi:hypothetical protein
MAQVIINATTRAKYDAHHYHVFTAGEIYLIGSSLTGDGNVYMPAAFAAKAIADGWASSTASLSNVQSDPSLENVSRASSAKKVVET